MAAISNRLSRLNWITVVFYPLTVILMETLWVYPWLVWMTKWADPDWYRVPLSLGALVILIGGAFVIARYFPDRRQVFLWMRLGIILLLIFGVVSLEFGAVYRFSAPFVTAVVAGIYISWRGISLGRSVLYFGDIAGYFIFGMVALVLLIILWDISLGSASFDSLASTVGVQVAGFFFFGLLSLALGNLQDIQRQVTVGGKGALSIRRWLPIQLGVVAGITLLGIGVASIFSPDFVAFLSRLISAVLRGISQALVYILYPLDWVARVIAFVIEWLVSLFNGGKAPELQTPPLFEQADPNEVPNTALPPDFISFIKWALFIIVVIVVLVMLVRALNRYRAGRAGTEVEEIQESLGSWRGLKEDLKLLLRGIWRRLKRTRKAVETAAPPAWQYSEVAEGGLDIREIYRRLLWEGADNGVTRRSYETPDEYARRLVMAVPDTGDGLDELTGIYVARRYGEIEATDKETRANSLWRLIHRLLRRPVAGE